MKNITHWSFDKEADFLINRLEMLQRPINSEFVPVTEYMKNDFNIFHLAILKDLFNNFFRSNPTKSSPFSGANTKMVDISKLYPCQGYVNTKTIERKLGGDTKASSDFPQVIELQSGMLLVIDGHHRICAHIEGKLGNKIKVEYIKSNFDMSEILKK